MKNSFFVIRNKHSKFAQNKTTLDTLTAYKIKRQLIIIEGDLFWWYLCVHSLYKKWSFPLRISSVNVTKSAVSYGFGYIYWRNPEWKTSLFVQWIFLHMHLTKKSTLQTARLYELSAMQRLRTAVQCMLHGTYFEPVCSVTKKFTQHVFCVECRS